MKLIKNTQKEVSYKYLQVDVDPRYWEDAEVNGESDEEGSNVPFKTGSQWKPLIDLESGMVVDWPNGVTASFYFKVCDAGDYYLLDESKNVVATHNNYYVPNGLLCYGDNGFGDYIIFSVDESGKIIGYEKPDLEPEHWD
jgi:hypothetical protein